MTSTNAVTVDSFLADLTARGVALALGAGGELVVRAPRGALTERDRRLLQTFKPAIIAHLSAPAAVCHGATVACATPGCAGEVYAYDATGAPWCVEHLPPTDPAGTSGHGSWVCAPCAAEVDAVLPRCPRCLRRPDGTPSPCSVQGCAHPALRDAAHGGGAGPALEAFCPLHRRGAEVLHLACARGWPALSLPDGRAIAAGKAAWLAAVTAPGADEDEGEGAYLRLLVWTGWAPTTTSTTGRAPAA